MGQTFYRGLNIYVQTFLNVSETLENFGKNHLFKQVLKVFAKVKLTQ